jgi:hypothetical protein
VSSGQFFNKYLKLIKLNAQMIRWRTDPEAQLWTERVKTPERGVLGNGWGTFSG